MLAGVRGYGVSRVHGFMLGIIAAGIVPDPSAHGAFTGTYTGSMFGVSVRCVMYAPGADVSQRWADVSLYGGPFGSAGVAGRAWYQGGGGGHGQILVDPKLDKMLSKRRVKLLAVDPSPDGSESLLLHVSLPLVGSQRMFLTKESGREDRWCDL